jgi:hypothetical protein
MPRHETAVELPEEGHTYIRSWGPMRIRFDDETLEAWRRLSPPDLHGEAATASVELEEDCPANE